MNDLMNGQNAACLLSLFTTPCHISIMSFLEDMYRALFFVLFCFKMKLEEYEESQNVDWEFLLVLVKQIILVLILPFHFYMKSKEATMSVLSVASSPASSSVWTTINY